MDNHQLVRAEHLNHHGTLFGGQLLLWVDEFAWMSAAIDFPGYSFVTRAMDNIEFKHPVKLGTILKFESKIITKRTSSVSYFIEIYESNVEYENNLAFSTTVTFVSIDKDGNKKPF